MNDWRSLFATSAPDPTDRTIEFWVVRKHGEDLLILPLSGREAAQAMDLYPAQTMRARLARHVLQAGLRLGLPIPLPRARVLFSETSDLARLLAEVRGSNELPVFGILCGNPRGSAPRQVIVVFDAQGAPAVVVKAGTTPGARESVRREAGFLQDAASVAGAPRVLARFASPALEAFAIDFVAGKSPKTGNPAEIARLLTSWIDTSRLLPLGDIPAWQRFPPAASRLSALAGLLIHPVIFHGDFAPWNVRVAAGRWTVLDWERGEITGVPGWDWFHFQLQHAILVRRCSTEALIELSERLLVSEEFQRYASTAAICGHERPLLLGYLYYAVEVLRPTEGLDRLQALLRAWEATVGRLIKQPL